jgi:hypothetical protein
MFVPRGTRHGFTVEAGSKALLFIIPGGLGGFFRELGAGLLKKLRPMAYDPPVTPAACAGRTRQASQTARTSTVAEWVG